MEETAEEEEALEAAEDADEETAEEAEDEAAADEPEDPEAAAEPAELPVPDEPDADGPDEEAANTLLTSIPCQYFLSGPKTCAI